MSAQNKVPPRCLIPCSVSKAALNLDDELCEELERQDEDKCNWSGVCANNLNGDGGTMEVEQGRK